MHFDLDAWRKTTELPTVTIGGTTHTGRLLSYQEFIRFQERLAEMMTTGSVVTTITLIEDYFTAVFPPKKYVVWKPSVVSQLMTLPNVMELFTSFLALQTQAMGRMSRTDS